MASDSFVRLLFICLSTSFLSWFLTVDLSANLKHLDSAALHWILDLGEERKGLVKKSASCTVVYLGQVTFATTLSRITKDSTARYLYRAHFKKKGIL